jgi:hypothetical protein
VYDGVECIQPALVKTLINVLLKSGKFLGQLTVISYSDSVPSISNTQDHTDSGLFVRELRNNRKQVGLPLITEPHYSILSFTPTTVCNCLKANPFSLPLLQWRRYDF